MPPMPRMTQAAYQSLLVFVDQVLDDQENAKADDNDRPGDQASQGVAQFGNKLKHNKQSADCDQEQADDK